MKTSRIRKLGVALLFGALMTLLFTVTAFAGNQIVTKSMPLGKAVSVSNVRYGQIDTTYTFYKVKITEGKYLKVTVAPNANYYGFVNIYDRKKVDPKYLVTTLQGNSSATWKKSIALDPGTYYLSFTHVKKIRVQTPAAANKSNFRKANAQTLKAKKMVTIAQAPATGYARWYKIKLTKAKYVTIYFNYDASVSLRKSNGNKCSLGQYNFMDKCVSSTKKLAKGTYYIYVDACTPRSTGTAADKLGFVTGLKWK